jgi:hypothetical protein
VAEACAVCADLNRVWLDFKVLKGATLILRPKRGQVVAFEEVSWEVNQDRRAGLYVVNDLSKVKVIGDATQAALCRCGSIMSEFAKNCGQHDWDRMCVPVPEDGSWDTTAKYKRC